MGDHMVYQVKAQWSLDPQDPTQCLGEEVSWRPPGQDGWNLRNDNAHAGNPYQWCVLIVIEHIKEIVGQLPRAMPFE